MLTLGAMRGTALTAHGEEARTGGCGQVAFLVWRELDSCRLCPRVRDCDFRLGQL